MEEYLSDFLNSSLYLRFKQTTGLQKLQVAHVIRPSSVLIDGKLCSIEMGELLFIVKGQYGRKFFLACFLTDPTKFGLVEADICSFENFPVFSEKQISVVNCLYENDALKKAGFQSFFAPPELQNSQVHQMIAMV